MNTKPDPDWPYPFFFNGVPCSPWAGTIHELVNWGRFLNKYQGSWNDSELSYHDVRVWIRKWDSSFERVRSYDPARLRIFLQELLIVLLENGKSIHRDLVKKHPKVPSEEATMMIEGMTAGLRQCRSLALKSEVCFWVKGKEPILDHLKAVMYRCGLPADHPEYMRFPHLVDASSDLKLIRENQVYRLSKLGFEFEPTEPW